MLIQEDIQTITNNIVAASNPLAIYLFGSYAKGMETADSDIDLCLVTESSPNLVEVRLSLQSIPKAFDIVAFSQDDFSAQTLIWWSIPAQIQQEGVKLYDRPAQN